MSKENALLLAQELANEGKWNEVCSVCTKFFANTDDLSYEILNSDQKEKLAILKIESLIRSFSFNDFLSFNNLDYLKKSLRLQDYEDRIKDTGDVLIVVILSIAYLKFDKEINISINKIKNWHKKIQCVAQEQFCLFFDECLLQIHSNILAGGRIGECISREDVNTYMAYVVMCSLISLSFSRLCDYFGIKKNNKSTYTDNSKYKCDTERIIANKYFDLALSFTQDINKLSNDFPYLSSGDAQLAITLYESVFLLTNFSLTYDKTLDENVKIVRLKHKINSLCDYLNRIVISDGRTCSLVLDGQRQIKYNDVLKCEKAIQEIESGYTHPVVCEEVKVDQGGCYVATAVYGSYDCPQVWTLRRYRDYTLAGTWYGRAFIKTYYSISPTLVKWFGNTEWFKQMWRGTLDSMVERLQSKGVKDTPYEDVKWK